MGDPRRQHKQYKTPSHPWQARRIELEREIIRGYGLKNKKEIWKMDSTVEGFKDQVKGAIASHDTQRQKERRDVLKKVAALGMIKEGEGEDQVLGLQLRDVMERRLQTQLLRKGIARTVKQARQFIVHGHITVNGKVVTAPG